MPYRPRAALRTRSWEAQTLRPARSGERSPVVASRMADVTFRDFAGAIMKGDVEAAGVVLQQLLGLDAAVAATAAQYFQAQAAANGPAFMGKAMGLRAAVTSGSEAEIGALLTNCFGLADAPLATASATLQRKPG